MKRLALVNLTAELLDAFCLRSGENAAALLREWEHRFGRCAEIVQRVACQTRALMSRRGGASEWFGYLALDTAADLVVGTCSFKGPPNQVGEVEIAYFTFPGFQGCGWGGAMAKELVRIAFSYPEVSSVVAHTLPEEGASTRILRAVGMEFLGEVANEEDGIVWRWRLAREAASP